MTVELNAYQAPEHAPFLWPGERVAALFVHGFPGTPAEMRPVAELIHAHGWTTQGILLPGYGADFAQIARHGHREWIAAITDAADALAREHAAVVMVGNSMGAALVLHIAAQPRGDALLLFAPFRRAFNRAANAIFPLAQRLIRELRPFKRADFSDERFRDAVLRFLPDVNLDDEATQEAIRGLTLPTAVLGEVRQAGRLGYRDAAKVRQPVTIIQGRMDEIADPDLTRQLAARLPNLTRLHMVEGDHHLTLLHEPTRQVVSDAVVGFVQQISAAVR